MRITFTRVAFLCKGVCPVSSAISGCIYLISCNAEQYLNTSNQHQMYS